MKSLRALVVMTALAAVLVAGSRLISSDQAELGYWVWRWSDLELVDSTDTLLLYQGDFHSSGENPVFLKRGVDPFELPERSEVGLVVRLYDIEDAAAFADQVIYLVREWQNRKVTIVDIQLDYDSPSSRLLEYRQFINRTRSQLDREKIYTPLSITGLLTWHRDNPQALELLAESVAYIAFQLYDDHDPVADVDRYLASLRHFDHPYKIGISTSKKFDRMEFPGNENYQGNLVFLNVPQ